MRGAPLLWIFITLCTSCQAQTAVDFVYESNGLENDTVNVIQNASYLDHFFQRLRDVRNGGGGKVAILHIGDSHIQGDYLTQPIRAHLQNDFGNAGRGLIVAGKVAGTNEGYNIRTSSDVEWRSKRCVHPQNPLPIGVGGITISTSQPGKLFIGMADPEIDYSFNTVTLFYENDSLSFDFVLRDSASRQLAIIRSVADEQGPYYQRTRLPGRFDNVQLQLIKARDSQSKATIFGVSLENDNAGILYHSIGVNGAKFKHYNAAPLFAKQTAALHPELIIVSMGTNEALDYPYLDQNFSDHLNELIGSLQQYNPEAQFILTTPPPAFRRKKMHNPGLESIRESIIQFAVENGYAFWDVYKILGGYDGAVLLKEQGLMKPDGIHFTKEGYKYQADLFYRALSKGYNDYVFQLRP